MAKKRSYKKPLTCPVCGKRFYYSAKAHPLGRLSKHLAKDHPRFKRKPAKRKQRYTDAQEEDLLDELQLFDDLQVAGALGTGSDDLIRRLASQSRMTPEHEQLGGIILGIASAIAKQQVKKAVQKRVQRAKAKRQAKRK